MTLYFTFTSKTDSQRRTPCLRGNSEALGPKKNLPRSQKAGPAKKYEIYHLNDERERKREAGQERCLFSACVSLPDMSD